MRQVARVFNLTKVLPVIRPWRPLPERAAFAEGGESLSQNLPNHALRADKHDGEQDGVDRDRLAWRLRVTAVSACEVDAHGQRD